MNIKLKCIKPIEGFTVGKDYNLLGCAGELVELLDDNNEKTILYESYFEIINKKEVVAC
jgi:hypothetical protein